MKTIFTYLLLIICLPVVTISAQTSFGRAQLLNDSWEFTLDTANQASGTFRGYYGWSKVDLPHDWSVKGALSPEQAACTGFLPGGLGFYRKNLTIPREEQGNKVYLYFEGVYKYSSVYVNDQLVATRPNGYISFLCDITDQVDYTKENVITVKVDHRESADSRWYTGSGIYRNVWLVYSNPVHIDLWGVYARPVESTAKRGRLEVDVTVTNPMQQPTQLVVKQELKDPKGNIVASNNQSLTVKGGEKATAKSTLTVKNPSLWDLNNPSLYELYTSISENGKVIDSTVTTTGFRDFRFDPDKGFALNGQWMKMKGVCLHHDAGVLGAAVPREVWKRRLQTLKDVGCNAIRTSHNPQAPDLYALCDELGLLVMNEAYDEWEFPKRKWLKGWNVGIPGFQGAYVFFEEYGEKDLADMVLRDRNHVSIFAWSIGNEVDYPNDPYSHPVLDGGKDTGFTQAMFGGYHPDAPDAMRLGGIAKRLAAVVRQYDNRPVTAGLAGVAMSNETEYPGALDIAGYNYTESMYDSDHAKYPKRVIYGSENRHDMDAWKAVRDKQHIFGQFLWTGIDYLGESGVWPSRGFYSGLLDFGGFTKPRGYFRKALWTEEPFIYIGTYRPGRRDYLSPDAWPVWNYKEGETIRVVCYTNTAQARLELNGQQVGDVKPYDDNTGILAWDIPYRDGKLEVVGLDVSGKETTRYAITSSGRPQALTIVSANREICANKGVGHVVLQVVDEKGVPVMLSDDEITCTIEGPGKLLGLEAGNNQDMTDYTDNVHRVFHGRILAYVQAQGAGDITVKFNAPWLKSTEVILKAK